MPIHPLEPRRLCAATVYVSPAGDDAADGLTPATAYRHVQHAIDVAPAGATIVVAAGRYRERLTVTAGHVTLRAAGPAVLDGRGVNDGTPILTITAGDVAVAGFEIVNYTARHGGSAVLVQGAADGVRLTGNTVHHTRGFQATAIGVYGTDPVTPITNLTIDGNTVYDCRPADSETITLNGNVTKFAVTNNTVRDTNNIGIDFIGGEGTSPDPATDAARDGTCAANHVSNAHARYGGGYAAGIYVDGGRDIVLERNTVDGCDLGIEVGCEHAGRTTTNVTVRDNLVTANRRAGIGVGGYAAAVGRVADCTVVNNTLVGNQTRSDGAGELWVQLADRCTFADNLIVAGPAGIATSAAADAGVTGTGNTSDHNLFFTTGRRPLRFGWSGQTYDTAAAYRAATGQDAASQFGVDPRLTDGARPSPGSPAINAGNPAADRAGPLDLYGKARVVGGRIDIGAVESDG